MDKQEAAVIKVLNDIGVREEPQLSPEQEEMLARALDPEKDFMDRVEKLFKKSQ